MPPRATRFPPLATAVLLALVAITLPAVAVAQSPLVGLSQTVRVAFFPPDAPVFGAPIPMEPPRSPGRWNGRLLTPPDGLADFVNETFYPPLSTRLFSDVLGKKVQARVDAYRARRSQLVNALLEQLHVLQGADLATRERELRAFAEQQSPQIVALEAEAGQLRADLVSGGLFAFNVDWNDSRAWRIGQTVFRRTELEREAEFQVVRAAAYYSEGFTAQQRGLLREVAAELQVIARKARSVPTPTKDDELTAIFFSPEMARMRVPPNLPPALHAKLGRFNGEKAALKRELREAVFEQDRASALERGEAFARLAESQWPRLVALDKLAEEIRVELAVLPEPPPPAAPPSIPAPLIEEIGVFNAARDAYYRELDERILRAMSRVSPPEPWVPADQRPHRQRQYIAERLAARRDAVENFQNENRDRFEALGRQRDDIRKLLAAVAESQKDPKTGRPLNADTLLERYMSSMREFDRYGREDVIYKNYRAAMLEPGLSPEQRRLLFGITLIGLAQPLPNGEMMPQSGASTPMPRS